MKQIIFIMTLSIAILAYAGGNPEHVLFPKGYQTTFTKYDTRNRSNGKQVAVLYANPSALASATNGQLQDGSKLIMEIYKTKSDQNGNPIVGTDQVFEKGALAAVAVMEKRHDWGSEFDPAARAGQWGFALYTPDGKAKANDLICASCHIPMPENDYLFSLSRLTEFAIQN